MFNSLYNGGTEMERSGKMTPDEMKEKAIALFMKHFH